jgi:hypothetical protein
MKIENAGGSTNRAKTAAILAGILTSPDLATQSSPGVARSIVIGGASTWVKTVVGRHWIGTLLWAWAIKSLIMTTFTV